MGGPLRQGAAVFTALRAVFSWFQARRDEHRRYDARPGGRDGHDERARARDDDEGMFVG
jgi:hypothetical protein